MCLNIKQKLGRLPSEVLIDKKIINSNIRGVYGIFSCDKNKKK